VKDSGIEWIGEVSEHWKVRRLEDLVAVIDPQLIIAPISISQGKGYPYIGIRDVNHVGL
jgi:hypothetical protein